MSYRRIIFILFIFILSLTALRFSWLENSMDIDSIEAQQGVLDLRGVNFSKEPVQGLRGEWEFHPGVLLNPEEIQDQSAVEYISLPRKWHDFFDEDTPWTERQGTYRLKLLVPEERLDRLFQIQLPRNALSSKVYINGRLLLDNDFSLQGNGDLVSNAVPRSTSFRAGANNELEVLIQFKGNSLAKRDGLKKTILFGDDRALNAAGMQNIAKQLLILSLALICAAYTFIFFIIRKGKHHFLYFSLASLCLVIATGLDDDRILLNWIQLSYSGYVKLLFLSYIGTVAFLLLFTRNLFAVKLHTRTYNGMIGALIAGTLAVVVTPLQYLPVVVTSVFLLLGLFLGAIAVLIWKMAKGRHNETVFVMLAAVSGANSFLWGIYSSRLDMDLPYYPYDILIAYICLSIFLFLLFFRTGNENRQMTVKLQEELKRKDQFLSNTAHEMKNPLHSIMNITDSILLQERQQLPAEVTSRLRLMSSISRHMSFTLNDLLDISRVKEHTLQLKPSRVNMKSLVSGIVEMLEITIKHKRIKVIIDMDASLEKVQADENRVIQILFNLIHNAVKFTEKGTIRIRGEAVGKNAVLTVEDTGTGMDPLLLEKIFEPYVQEEASSGLGLGLTISRQLAELHGGTLDAVTEQGSGSAFTLTLPFENGMAEGSFLDNASTGIASAYETMPGTNMQTMPALTEQTADRPRAKILLIDDDPINLKVFSDILSRDEYDVRGAASGELAMKLIDEQQWDLVITDVMMPKISGYRLTAMIREKFSHIELPVLQLTARNHPEDIYNGFLSGANDYVSKPVSGLELRARVENLTRLKKSVSDRLRVEGAWLQAQIKPHFLFNTLNAIVSLGQFDPVRMAGLMEQFGNYLRRSFTPDNLDRLVCIKNEVELVRSYLYIEKERFGDRLEVVWNMAGIDGLEIPPLSLQTLVENAVQHGVLKRVEGGIVEIRIRKLETGGEISIIDDGMGMDRKQIEELLSSTSAGEGIGIINTDRRLKQLYGEGLEIESEPGKGTKVSFRVRPLEFAEETE